MDKIIVGPIPTGTTDESTVSTPSVDASTPAEKHTDFSTEKEKAIDAVERARPQSSDWLRFSDQEATERIRQFGRVLLEQRGKLSFQELQNVVADTLATMASVDAAKRLMGKDNVTNISLYSNPDFMLLYADFRKTIAGAFAAFGMPDGKIVAPSSKEFQLAMNNASKTATEVIIDRFKKPGESRLATLQRLLQMAQAIDAESKYAYVFATSLKTPSEVRNIATPEEWKKFVGYVFAMPNAGWMGGIFGRTLAGQMVKSEKNDTELILPLDKSNVGTYGQMMTEINRLGVVAENADMKQLETEALRIEIEKDKKEVVEWLNRFIQEEKQRDAIVSGELPRQ